jgi:D-glycero-beta-D-manno-heptose-7-phosphate kinase
LENLLRFFKAQKHQGVSYVLVVYFNMLEDIVDRFGSRKIMVVGDVMLDKYIFGRVDRISPEAPVPIVHAMEEKYVLGGAANVANNIKALGGVPLLVGMIGNDAPGKILIRELKKAGIAHIGMVTDNNVPTIQKIRVLSGNQQLLRLDYEEHNTDSDGEILRRAESLVKESDIIIVSDYAKGVINNVTMPCIKSLGKKYDKRVIVDTRPSHKSLYKKVYLITPNRKESEEMTGLIAKDSRSISMIGKKLQQELSCNVLITLGERGMSLYEHDNVQHISTAARQVYDVSGAGDTVVATIGLSLAAGASLKDSALISNYAAGIVVGKIGTATLSREELVDAINVHKLNK